MSENIVIESGGNAELTLDRDENGLWLTDGNLRLRADFREMLPRVRQNNLNRELIVRAAKIKNAAGPLTAVDATAGLGEDAFLLAAAGFQVRLYERDPVIAALLADALKRAAGDPDLMEIAGRMRLYKEDSITALRHLDERPDVVLLDPMFPERTKKAKIKKKFQLLQQLERPGADEDELLAAAMAARPRKILIKRMRKGPYLAGRKPDYSITGSTIRYDVIQQQLGDRP